MLLRGGFTRVEQTLVVGFMSGNQQAPDIICEIFVLAPTDLLDDPPGS